MSLEFDVIIIESSGIRFKGKATSVTFYNQDGQITILKNHADYVGLCTENWVIIDGVESFLVEQGCVKFENNKLEIVVEEVKESKFLS